MTATYNINIKREQGFKTHRTYRTAVEVCWDGRVLKSIPMMLTRLFRHESIEDAMSFIGVYAQCDGVTVNVRDV